MSRDIDYENHIKKMMLKCWLEKNQDKLRRFIKKHMIDNSSDIESVINELYFEIKLEIK